MRQMPTEMGGGAGKVAFIDTEGTFRPERIRPIAARFNLDVEAVLENVSAAPNFHLRHPRSTSIWASEGFPLHFKPLSA